MWSPTKQEETTLKENLFNDLYTECRMAAPGAKLTYLVRSKLERFSRHERKEIVSKMKYGCSPLFLASKKGNVEVVEYLITMCDANVEQKGTYEVPDDRTLHYVSPLWCASVAGKLNVVKCLISHGANVNAVSDTGSTPVRSACFMTHLDVVTYLVENGADILKPNHNGGTCLINSVQSVDLCGFLLKNGAQVNAQDIQQKTALHYAIQEHRTETMLLLLKHGADPYIKSRYGDDALQTACLKGATEIVQYLLDNLDYSVERRAEAQELLGATFLDEHHNIQVALRCWRNGLKLRNITERGIGPDSLRKPQYIIPKAAYLFRKEFETFQELENLSYDLDAMHIQSLLITERVLGKTHKDMIFRCMYRGAAYADSLQHQRCIDLWRYALELRVVKDSLLHGEAWFNCQTLVRLFFDLNEKHTAGLLPERVHYEDVVGIIELLVNEFESAIDLLSIRPVFKKQQDHFDKILKIMTHLFFILNQLPKTDEQMLESRRLLHRVIRINPNNSMGDSLLHLAVSRENTLKSNNFFEDALTDVFPSPEVVQLLIECGADVEATNHNHSTALHVASMRLNYRPEVIAVLLKYGAHLDRRNSNGNHPHRMLAGIKPNSVNPLEHITLKCLAARKIVEKRITYSGQVPIALESFISIH